MIDPRPAVVENRLRSIRRIIGVTGGKGGVGKTLVASTSALLLARAGKRVGLFDLDFSGPTTHLVLGAEPAVPDEVFGIDPPDVRGIAYMSVIHFTRDDVAPLRGDDLTNAILELLAITRWPELDVLFLDMPPGIGDVALDVLRLIDRAEHLVVTTPSKLSLNVAAKLVSLLDELDRPPLGILLNMCRADERSDVASTLGETAPVLGTLRADNEIEDAIGDPDRLLRTGFASDLEKVVRSLLE